jgi:hypothetical protein
MRNCRPNYTVIVSGSRVYTSVAHVISHWDNDDYWLNQNITVRPREPKDITDVFECENFLKNIRESLGKGNNEPIFDYEVAGIDAISFSGRGITSIAGIEYFTSLLTLNVGYNPITNLDLSHNKRLTHLVAWGTQLSTVNISNNKYVQLLVIIHSNLTEIDLSNNKALQYLFIYDNNLEKLDLSNNCNLRELSAQGNQLSDLNLPNSQNFNFMVLNLLDNNLTQLDVSNNPNILFLDVRFNRMNSPDDVLGWREIGLILGQNFRFYPQRNQDDSYTDVDIYMDDWRSPSHYFPWHR